MLELVGSDLSKRAVEYVVSPGAPREQSRSAAVRVRLARRPGTAASRCPPGIWLDGTINVPEVLEERVLDRDAGERSMNLGARSAFFVAPLRLDSARGNGKAFVPDPLSAVAEDAVSHQDGPFEVFCSTR